MYYAIIAGLMLVFPAISVAAEMTHPASPLWPLVGKWFVFWAVGVRLLLAGLKQVTQPRYTAEKILGLKGDDVLFVVRELGFANLAFGVTGVVSLFVPGWVPAAALAGGIFYGLAGVNHVLTKGRKGKQSVAMVTDLWAAVVLLGFVGWVALR